MSFDFKKWNKLTGWFIFLIATTVYFLTMEDTASLWDCGEYITAAYKLEVGHPPGAPFFMILGRLFSFFAEPESVALCINAMSALSSSFTILFMFWSLSLLIRKIISLKKDTLDLGDQMVVLIASSIGALAYTFSDSFWFSAVEGEVYAMSSLFTAVIFWAILKWDEEMGLIHKGVQINASPNRWLLLIMFLLGLAIGVHLLGILVVPSIGYIIYFRMAKTVNAKGFILTGVLSILVLGFIQKGVIPGSIAMASAFEVFFVNSIGMPFYSGSIFFFMLLITGLFFLIRYAQRNRKGILYNASLGLVFLLIGYGSFAVIVIRSNANTPLDENDPENLVTLRSYLEREQYGYTPLLTGPYFNSIEDKSDPDKLENANPVYKRKHVVVNGDKDVKAFSSKDGAEKFAKQNGGEVVEKYFLSNEDINGNLQPMRPAYLDDHTTFFPRMYSGEKRHVDGYKKWSGYDGTINSGDSDKPLPALENIGLDQYDYRYQQHEALSKYMNDAKKQGASPDQLKTYSDLISRIENEGIYLPSFGENLTYFARYQMNWMYWRYFMWNFAGRQNDIQGHGDQMRGNWISGFSFIDNARLGNQSSAPNFTTENPANNKFYLLPLILALVGLFFHFYTSPKDAFVLLLSFLFTGLAIVIYLNQKPIEPRERDYAYAGSFYFFAMWIGIGTYALYHFLRERNILKKHIINASLSGALCLSVPMIMAIQGWDDHNRDGKTSARDLAHNYLESCTKNGILFTHGDNDTFPLWYLQEVEGKRTDVRVCNLSLMGTDWYTNQMKMKAYESEPLPIKFDEDQIEMMSGNTDAMLISGLDNIAVMMVLKSLYPQRADLRIVNSKFNQNLLKEIFAFRLKSNKNKGLNALTQFDQSFNLDILPSSQRNAAIENLLRIIQKENYNTSSIKQRSNNIEKYLSKGKELLQSPVDSADLSKTILKRYLGAAYMTVAGQLIDGEYQLFQELKGSGIVGVDRIFYPYQSLMSPVDDVQSSLSKLEDPGNNAEDAYSWTLVHVNDALDFVRGENRQIEGQSGPLYSVIPSNNFILKVNKKNAQKAGTITKNQLKECPDSIMFSYNSGAMIGKSEIMMLDVLANNDWERGIFFSGLGNSKLTDALKKVGYVKQIGIAYEVSPIREENPTNDGFSLVDKDKMYQNLTKVYQYGNMSDPGVLTDYYARRHVMAYRDCFINLARAYFESGEILEQRIDFEKKMGTSDKASSLETTKKNYFKKAEELLDLCQKEMPYDHIFDIGDGMGTTGDNVVIIYCGIGKFKKADELANKLVEDYKSIINYFKSSDDEYLLNEGNTVDLYFAMAACFRMQGAAQQYENDALANKLKGLLLETYSQLLDPALKKYAEELSKNRYFDGLMDLKSRIIEEKDQAKSP